VVSAEKRKNEYADHERDSQHLIHRFIIMMFTDLTGIIIIE